jgi:hypothetical protein
MQKRLFCCCCCCCCLWATRQRNRRRECTSTDNIWHDHEGQVPAMIRVSDTWRRSVQLRPSASGRVSVQQIAHSGSAAWVSKPQQAFVPKPPIRRQTQGRSAKEARTQCNECSSLHWQILRLALNACLNVESTSRLSATNSAGHGRPWESYSRTAGQEISRPLCDHMALSSQEPATSPCPQSNKSSSHPHTYLNTVSPRLASCLRSRKPRCCVKLR